ncbi:MAG: DNA repair exonuclease SbcCD ATPase subunit [Oceanospirillaceae bacterium]|jgi:DNA repair exonuclease SbcCD ATPase subunit
MDDRIDTAKVHEFANELLFSGNKISVQAIADKMHIEASEELGTQLEHWWMEQESKVVFRRSISPNYRPDVPETVYQSVQLIWDNAVKDVRLELELASKNDKPAAATAMALEDELYLSKAQLEALEDSHQRLRVKLSEGQNSVKNLEAERAMLRSNLQSAETNASTMSHKVSEAKAEMQRAQSSSEEAKKQLDTRMKEEVGRHQESISKVENKLSYYRHQLDKLRDDWGKKETALNSQVQDLQGAVARSTVTHDTQFSQIRSQDEELRKYRGEITNQSRSMTQSTSMALASKNRLKRLEDELQQSEFDIKELKKRTIVDKSDTDRRETDLRTLLKSKDGENFEIINKLNELQRTLIAREEEIRRLTAKL